MLYDLVKNDFTEHSVQSDKPAVIGPDETLSWKELALRAEMYSSLLEKTSVQSGHPVVIYGHKQAGIIAAMISLMRKNIPYIPVDINVPPERIKRIREISGSELLINFTNKEDLGFRTVIHDGVFLKQDPKADYTPIPQDKNDPLRYIIFTSGSTGEPKGVLIAAEALKEFVPWTQSDFKLKREDVFINIAPFSFDLSVFELFSFLHLGATLLLNTSADSKNPDTLFKNILKHKGSVWVSTPSFAYMFLNAPGFSSKNLSSVRAFMFCGEVLPRRTVEMLHERFPGAAVYNPYGPTEATCCTTNIDVTPGVLEKYGDVPVGFPKPGSEVRVVNESNDPSQPGEIIISGNHVAHGYLNRKDLTGEKFFLHNEKRAYRTGDQGYYKDNILFFLGRNDDQVKLHGFRIEMEEISSVIAKTEGVADAVTIALKRNGIVKKIVSFVKPVQKGVNRDELLKQIKSNVSRSLPEYMMPGDFRFIDEFPYSTSHKIDRKKLEEIYLSQS